MAVQKRKQSEQAVLLSRPRIRIAIHVDTPDQDEKQDQSGAQPEDPIAPLVRFPVQQSPKTITRGHYTNPRNQRISGDKPITVP